jgi:ribosome-binding ATPase
MDPEEARALLEEFGVAEPGLDRVIAASYSAIDLITFLTTGEDETRAWEVRRGAHAPEAAGVIHTDLERGFIRAEVVGWEDLLRLKTLVACREAGLLRLEGKEYEMKDGDVTNIRFNV